ncbi:MAG TPA: DUF1573 domain-containing protein [Thermoguttaceae bacterium]|nr:DUF1573 domain-containing protein [Thermoguttaceae bacterium]
MRSSLFLVPLCVALCVSSAAAGNWAADLFETTKHDFGAVARGAKVEYKFTVKNCYLEDVHIASVRSSCGCTQVRVENPLLKTYETGEIVATIDTRGFWGQRGATLTVTFDKPYYAEVQLQDSVYIRSDVVFEPGSVTLGEVDQGQSVEKKVSVSHTGRGDWRVVEVRSDNPHVSAKLVNGKSYAGQVSYDIVVRVDEKAPAGYLRDHIVLVTNDQTAKQVPLLVEGRVLSGVTVSPAPLFLGVVKPGEKVSKQIVVRAKKPFKITGVTCSDGGFEFHNGDNAEAKPWHLLPITFIGGDSKGKVSRTIQIHTDLDNRVSDLPAYAVVTDGKEN